MYVCMHVHWCNILVCTYSYVNTRMYIHVLFPVLSPLDEGGQQTAMNGTGEGGLHSPKEASPGARGNIKLPSSSCWMRLSPPRTTQVETHGTLMTDPLP